MDAIRNFFATWGPWIAVSLLPTIIAGLSNAPQTKHLAAVGEKALAYFKQAMGFLSVATYKDVPGTFKAPLTKAKTEPHINPERIEAPRHINGAGGTTVLLLLCALSSLPSCAWLGANAEKTKQVMIDCTQQAVLTNAPHLLPVVTAIVQSQSPDWKRMLEAIAKELSRDVIACSLQQVAIELQAKVPASGAEGNPVAQQNLKGMQRARMFLEEKKWEIQE